MDEALGAGNGLPGAGVAGGELGAAVVRGKPGCEGLIRLGGGWLWEAGDEQLTAITAAMTKPVVHRIALPQSISIQ